VATLPWPVLTIALIFALATPPAGGYNIGYMIGRLLLPTLVGAACAWLFARRSDIAWPTWRLALVALPFFLLVLLLLAAGRLGDQA